MGDVTGRVIGASPGGYVYPLGNPELKVPLVIDAGVGTFTLRGLPTRTASLVLYDGADRAELVPIQPSGGRVNRLADRYGAAATLSDELLRMPLAATVIAVAVPDGGATPWKPTFALPGTDHQALVPTSGGVYTVFPLPAGRYPLDATLPGFLEREAVLDVIAGTTMAGPVALPVDTGAVAPGCVAVSPLAPAPCENGLACEAADGRCYECTAADARKCPSGKCAAATHLCEPQAPPRATYCSACTASGGCPTGMICRIASGATAGYCTKTGCAVNLDCPAGFECTDAGVCRPPLGCDAWVQTMASVCYSDDRCHDGLASGWCQQPSEHDPGYCTASCSVSQDCAVGSVTTLTCTSGRCTP